jgi:hypothetical protein
MAKKPELSCCLGCGRDCVGTSGYCDRCLGRGHRSTQVSERKGRAEAQRDPGGAEGASVADYEREWEKWNPSLQRWLRNPNEGGS